MADKPGRRWREAELTGKKKAEQVLVAVNSYAGLKKVAIDRVLREKFDLKTPAERASWRKAYQRWHKKLIAEWAEAASRSFNEPVPEEKQRQPLGRKPVGMEWRDGAWQNIKNFHEK